MTEIVRFAETGFGNHRSMGFPNPVFCNALGLAAHVFAGAKGLPDQQDGYIIHIGSCGAGYNETTGFFKSMVGVIFF